MTFLVLQPLSADLLPAALALDQRCFGGLWSLESYRRELESPNSEVLVFVEKAEGSREVEGAREQKYLDSTLESHHSKLSSLSAQSATQNSKLSSAAARSATQNSSPPTPLIGLGCYWAILEEAHITMLAIDPAYQHQGLGQALLVALMVSAHQRGLERATLEVRVSNQAAVLLYQKFGFREAGRRRRYYPDNGEDAFVLWRGGLQKPEFSECLADWQQQVNDRLLQTGTQLVVERDRPVIHDPECNA